MKRLSQAEMEERRRQGLCFNCNEKFGRGHNKVCQRLFLDLDADDDNTGAPEEDADGEPHISLHPIAGIRTTDTMQVRLQLGDALLLALLDSRSTQFHR